MADASGPHAPRRGRATGADRRPNPGGPTPRRDGEARIDPDDHEAPRRERGKTVHGELANAGHRVLAPDDAEVEAYLETALNAPAPERPSPDRPGGAVLRGRGQPGRAGHRRRPRLRQPVRAADRAARPRAARLLRAAALRHAVARDREAAAARDHPVRRAIERLRGRVRRGPTRPLWSAGVPVLGICYGLHLMARELGGDVVSGREARVRPGDDHVHRRQSRSSPGSAASSRSG